MVIVLGLDVATTTGYGVLNGKGIKDYGLIKLDPKHSYSRRFKIFRKEILRLIGKYKPDTIVVENVYSGPNPKTTAYLNQLRGILIECIPEEVSIILPHLSTVKKEILNKGSCSKKDVFSWAIKKYPKLKDLTFNKHNDITDSILLAYFGKKS